MSAIMLNLSKIQLQLEKAKENLREVEENIQKVEGKTFSNGSARFAGLKVELTTHKGRNASLISPPDPRRRRIVGNYEPRNQFSGKELKRVVHEKRDTNSGTVGLQSRRHPADGRPGVFARLSGMVMKPPVEEEEEDELPSKPSLSSRVFTTSSDAPSRQEVIAAQTQDEQSKQRNRRMFGALVGTLHKFRKEETRVKEREEKRLKVEKKLEEDAKREKERLVQEKRALFLERKRREVEIKRIEWSLNRVKEYDAWEASMTPLHNFIQTQAKPPIFYLPNVHTAKTEERLAHSQKAVLKMIEKRKSNLTEEIEISERKARRNIADGGEEEAENIPHEDEKELEEAGATETHLQQLDDVDMEKENKYLGEDAEEDYAIDRDELDLGEQGKVDSEEDEGVVTEQRTMVMEEEQGRTGEEGEEDWVERTKSAEGECGRTEEPEEEVKDRADDSVLKSAVPDTEPEQQALATKEELNCNEVKTVEIHKSLERNTENEGEVSENKVEAEAPQEVSQSRDIKGEEESATRAVDAIEDATKETEEKITDVHKKSGKMGGSSRKRRKSRSGSRKARRSSPRRGRRSRSRSPRRTTNRRSTSRRRRIGRKRSDSGSPKRRSRSTSRKRTRRTAGKKRPARSSSSSSPATKRRAKSSDSSN